MLRALESNSEKQRTREAEVPYTLQPVEKGRSGERLEVSADSMASRPVQQEARVP